MGKKLKKYIKAFVRMLQHKPITAVIKVVEPDRILSDKVALITGGTSGIGKAIALEFHKAGATVVITGRDAVKTRTIAEEISDENAGVYGVGLDMRDVGQFDASVQSIIDLVPQHRIDILVNNAGGIGGDIRNTSEEDFDKVMDTNLKECFFLSKVVADSMIKRGVQGNILNVASSSSLRPAISAYTISKWGIRGLTLGLAKMLIRHGIVVNGIAPGPTATPLLQKNDYSDISHDKMPNGRYAVPEEIAAMALFLAGPQGRTIIGDIVYMTGGAGLIEISDLDYTYNPQ